MRNVYTKQPRLACSTQGVRGVEKRLSRIQSAMSDFLIYKEVSEDQYVALEAATSGAEEVKALLVNIMGLAYEDEKKMHIATDLFFYSYAFCKDHAFDGKKTSTFLSLMKQLFLRDMSEDLRADKTLSSSYEWFEAQLMKHCVERVPHSVLVFEDHEVGVIHDFVVEAYFRQFRMYRYIFGVQARVKIQMLLPQGIEIPKASHQPLTSGVQESLI